MQRMQAWHHGLDYSSRLDVECTVGRQCGGRGRGSWNVEIDKFQGVSEQDDQSSTKDRSKGTRINRVVCLHHRPRRHCFDLAISPSNPRRCQTILLVQTNNTNQERSCSSCVPACLTDQLWVTRSGRRLFFLPVPAACSLFLQRPGWDKSCLWWCGTSISPPPLTTFHIIIACLDSFSSAPRVSLALVRLRSLPTSSVPCLYFVFPQRGFSRPEPVTVTTRKRRPPRDLI